MKGAQAVYRAYNWGTYFSKKGQMWLQQSSNCHTCKIPAASRKSAIEFVFGFCSTIQHQHENRKRWKLKQPEQNTLAAAALLIAQRLNSHEVFLQIKRYHSHLLLGYAHFISPVHQHEISFLLGKLLHFFGCFSCYPLPFRHLVSIQLVLWETKI